ncbi:MAG: hypothetical protein Q7S04_04670 [Candidatus Moranbacteria bacterium]|nr:hypothetical protein [Candidatus Moranbacteria bacterium]
MTIRKDKIAFFEKSLFDFFRKAGREHLPWRKKKITAYEVWVAEVMLQQTQVSRVIGYYERFLKQFPIVQKLARVSWEEFLPYYEGLGYYTRGRNMLETAKKVVKDYGGKFPRDKKLLETLPGVGPYTAAAIMSFAYGDDHLAWDTNLRRVIGRFFFGTKNFASVIPAYEPESRSRVPPKVGRQSGMTLKKLEEQFSLPAKTLNAALMDFGSALCVGRPKCEACALRNRCVYYREKGRQETVSSQQSTRLPARQAKNKGEDKKQDWKNAQVYVFLHENHRKYFSSSKRQFRPFVLPSGYNTRSGIKKYFQEKYQLTLSVRPPYKKESIKGKQIFFVNAQILLGEPVFRVFPKKPGKEYNNGY